MKTLCNLLALALLAGCATPLNTPSGRPEATIKATPEQVRAALVSACISVGYSSRPGDTHNLLFEKDAGLGASILLGTLNDQTVIKRVRFVLVEDGAWCRVVGGFAILSASTRRETETTSAYQDLQKLINHVADRLNNPYVPPGPPPGSDL